MTAADPSKAENFYVGASLSGLNIDSQGSVWATTRFGNGLLGKAHLAELDLHGKFEGVVAAADYMTRTMSKQHGGTDHRQRDAAAAGRHASAERARPATLRADYMWHAIALVQIASPESTQFTRHSPGKFPIDTALLKNVS
jgi:hypothetical protein